MFSRLLSKRNPVVPEVGVFLSGWISSSRRMSRYDSRERRWLSAALKTVQEHPRDQRTLDRWRRRGRPSVQINPGPGSRLDTNFDGKNRAMGTFFVELSNSLLPRGAPVQLLSAVSTSFCLKQTASLICYLKHHVFFIYTFSSEMTDIVGNDLGV